MQAEDELQQQWQQERRSHHLSRMLKIIKIYHNRLFLSNFKSHIFQILLRPKTQPSQPQWPYKALLSKKNRTEEEELEVEFINMCAEKIQAVFKGHLTRKRHLKAMTRLRKFRDRLSALMTGWKVRQIFKCHAVAQRTKTINSKQKQVNKEREGNLSTPYAIRKLQYLEMTLTQDKHHFFDNFQALYRSGAWVFEPKTKITPIAIPRAYENVRPIKGGNFNQERPALDNQVQQSQPRKKRIREMRDKRERKSKGEEPPQMVSPEENEFVKIEENISRVSTTYPGQDRPIQAKGAYVLSQENIQEAEALAERPLTNNQESEVDTGKREQTKKAEKKKLDKRKKYDPRKAIQEEKKRKKQQMERQKEMLAQAPPPLKPQSSSQSDIDSQPLTNNTEKSRQKTKTDKDESNNRSTVNIPKAPKGKVEAKIDCWSNRKTVVAKKNIPAQEKQIRMINPHCNMEEHVEKKREELTYEKLMSIIQEKKREKDRSDFSEERMKALKQMEMHKEELQSTRNRKDSFGTGIQIASRKQQVLEQIRSQQRPRNVEEKYRPVQELEDAYNAQYIKRFKSLTPKLGLLQAAREDQSQGQIPVVQEWQADYLMEQCYSTHRFYELVHSMTRRLREFALS